jgi:predicted  nucleic acid-binding Zn-ribbon protein
MSVAKQLHQLQEIDLQITANERGQADVRGRIGPSRRLADLKAELATEQQHLGELQHDQRAAEWEAEDLTQKVKADEQKLFSGAIRNPKELGSLQKDAEDVKARRARVEDRTLEIMARAEAADERVKSLTAEIQSTDSEWRTEQAQLSAELENLTEAHSNLTGERRLLAAEVAHEALQAYEQIRGRKGTAVARVEQGTCRGCRIALPTTELQQVRGGGLVRCSSCGRILFLA